MQALKERESSRVFSDKELSQQMLSDLLWAAFGINRPESGKRTAPSAHNMQEIDVYVALASGLYRYEAQQNALQQILKEDIRAATGGQDFVATAPVNLIYVADYARMEAVDQKDRDTYAARAARVHRPEPLIILINHVNNKCLRY